MYYSNTDVRVEEMPEPEIGPGEILVKVMASGICGSDVMEWYRLKKAPRVLGHEITGDVVQVGEGVKDYRVGDRVFVSHHVPCGECHYCEKGHESVCDTLRSTNFDPGGFSEMIRVPRINVEKGVFKLPEEVSYRDGVLIEPLACVVRGQRLAGMREGLSVLILGSGMSGLLHIQLALARGASRVMATDLNEWRLEMARRLGAHGTINAKEDVPSLVKEDNGGRGADLVIVSTGSEVAANQAFECIDRGGTILFFAPTDPGIKTPVEITDIWKNEISLLTSYAGSPEDISEAIALIRDGEVKVREMVTHSFPLSKIQKGFDLAARAGQSIKVVIEPQEK